MSNHKIIFLRIREKKSLSVALNKGLIRAEHEIVVRMDPDDISTGNRFEQQLAAFEKNSRLSVCGSWVGEFSKDPTVFKIKKLPVKFSDIEKYATRLYPIAHPAVAFRRSTILALGGYPDIDRAQDYLLWIKVISSGIMIQNIPLVLLLFRTDAELLKRRNFNYFLSELQVFRYMKGIGFISPYLFYSNILIRFGVRLAPNWIKKLIYRIK